LKINLFPTKPLIAFSVLVPSFTIKILSTIAIGIVTNWLYDRLKKQTTGKTIINQNHITNNISIEGQSK
jgi:hypothetical protein